RFGRGRGDPERLAPAGRRGASRHAARRPASCARRSAGGFLGQAVCESEEAEIGEGEFAFTLPWRGRDERSSLLGRLTWSAAKCETGWGDLSTRALLDVERPSPHPAAHCMSADPRASFARLDPLQGRVNSAAIATPPTSG